MTHDLKQIIKNNTDYYLYVLLSYMENNPLRINFLSHHTHIKAERFPDSSVIGLEPYEIDIIYRYALIDDFVKSTNKVVNDSIPHVLTAKGKEKLQELSVIAPSLQKVPVYGLYLFKKSIHILNIILIDDAGAIGNIDNNRVLNTKTQYLKKIFFEDEYQDTVDRINLFRLLEDKALEARRKEISKIKKESKKEIKSILETLLIQE